MSSNPATCIVRARVCFRRVHRRRQTFFLPLFSEIVCLEIDCVGEFVVLSLIIRVHRPRTIPARDVCHKCQTTQGI